MPLYEFTCLDCSTTFTERRSFDLSNAAAACPSCHGEHTRKTVGALAGLNFGHHSPGKSKESIPVQMSGGCGCGSCACGH